MWKYIVFTGYILASVYTASIIRYSFASLKKRMMPGIKMLAFHLVGIIALIGYPWYLWRYPQIENKMMVLPYIAGSIAYIYAFVYGIVIVMVFFNIGKGGSRS